MEVAGLSLSALALASLFSTCLECFEYFQTAKSLRWDFEVLLLKLDCQRERLLTWGEIVGISKSKTEERNSDLSSTKHELIERALSSISTLFPDTEKLQKEYGVESVDPTESAEYRLERITSSRMHWFRKSYQRLAAHPNAQKQSSILLKTKWAIRHKTKFETLINHIKEIVTNLHDILPIPARSQEEMVHKDIALMSLPGLRRMENGFKIKALQAMNFLKRLQTIPRQSLVSSRKDSDIGCDQNTLGFISLKLHGETFLPGENTAIPKEEVLGKRITKFMNVRFNNDDMEMLRYNNFELSDFQSAALAANLPLGNVYIYCAPCVCAVRTALTICQQGGSKYLRYRTRVDDRISATCCPESTKIDRLVSLLNMVKTIEATDKSQTTGFATAWIHFIDRLWIEQRVYQLEEELHAENGSRSVVHDGDELFAELQLEYKETGIVVLGELDQCFWMLQTPPFPWKARIPKETEIYKVERTLTSSTWKRTYLGTYTPRAFGTYQTGNLPFRDQSTPTTTNGSVTTRWEPEPPALLNSKSQKSMENGEKDTRHNSQLPSEEASSMSPVDKKD